MRPFRARLRARFERAAARPFAADEEELARVPREGALLFVPSRRLRSAERAGLLALLRRARADAEGLGIAGAPEVAALLAGAARIADRCDATCLALARTTGATIVPLRVPRGRWRDTRARRVRIGAALPPASEPAAPERAAASLALRFAALAARAQNRSPAWPARVADRVAPVVARGHAAWLAREIDALAPARVLVPHERFAVATVTADLAPALLHEIGRLREVTFRAAGEGTGHALDLDAFDRDYLHLVAWDRANAELAGAYRLAETERILPLRGPSGLYTSTLFDYRDGFFERLGPAVELGRSFVSAGYQRSSVTLLLLWKGIARIVAARAASPVLFGAVSVSSRYGAFSRALVASALGPRGEGDLATRVRARRPAPLLPRALRDETALGALAGDVGALSAVVADAEGDGAALPVLVREYLKLGGCFLAWGVDPAFGDTQDGLVVVDLRRTAPRLLEFYLGRARAAECRARWTA